MKKESLRLSKILPCLQRDYSSLTKMLNPKLALSLPYLSLSDSVFDVLFDYFQDEELSLLFSFQSKYLGMSAWDCPGGFSMLSFIEHGYGIFHTMGGLSEISVSMADVARSHGAAIHLNSSVKRVLVENKTAIGIELESGEKITGDEIIINADFGHAMTHLFAQDDLQKYTKEKLDRKKFSCSTYMLHLGLTKKYDSEHHTIVFANEYRKNVEEIFKQKIVSDDFSFYVRNASVTDHSLAPKGGSSLYVLVPVPNMDGDIDWEDKKASYRDLIYRALEEKMGFKNISSYVEVEKIVTPLDWEKQADVYKGATFNLSHNLSQLAYFRPRNKFEEFDRCYLVGGGTHPGSGLPTILESARISSQMICDKYKVSYEKTPLIL
ncbi:MAG: phytoene desaturase family protein [Bdellovibrionota bacterium]